nr:hypothetical protein [Candidatus Njordarchaeota archaeon]
MILEDILISCLLVLTTVMLVISVLSYRRTRGKRILLASLMFTLFLIESVVLTLGIFFIEIRAMISTTFFVLIDLAIVVLMFVGTYRR